MTISAIRHNQIVRMLAEGTLSYGEIAGRVRGSPDDDDRGEFDRGEHKGAKK